MLLLAPNLYIVIILPPEKKEILKALVFLRLPQQKSFCKSCNTYSWKFSYRPVVDGGYGWHNPMLAISMDNIINFKHSQGKDKVLKKN